MNFRNLLKVLIVIAIIVGFKLFVYYNPASIKTDEEATADWKVYQNQELNFEIKYPSDWDDPREYDGFMNEYKVVLINGEDVKVEIKRFFSSKLFEKEISEEKQSAELINEVISKKRISFNGTPGQRNIYFNFFQQFQKDIISIEKGEYRYSIEAFITRVNPIEGKNQFILDQMLSTFKILK